MLYWERWRVISLNGFLQENAAGFLFRQQFCHYLVMGRSSSQQTLSYSALAPVCWTIGWVKKNPSVVNFCSAKAHRCLHQQNVWGDICCTGGIWWSFYPPFSSSTWLSLCYSPLAATFNFPIFPIYFGHSPLYPTLVQNLSLSDLVAFLVSVSPHQSFRSHPLPPIIILLLLLTLQR